MKTTPLPDLFFLEETLQIDSKAPSGLSWRNANGKKIKPGDHAGCLSQRGYWAIGLKVNGTNKIFMAHRIIYFMHYKTNIDQDLIDHIDLNKSNNSICNLRLADLNQNKWNQNKANIKTTSKYKGVHWCKRDNRWIATICCRGKRKAIGYYKTEIEAAKRYNEQALKIHGEFAKINVL
jgi:hypothetical protein